MFEQYTDEELRERIFCLEKISETSVEMLCEQWKMEAELRSRFAAVLYKDLSDEQLKKREKQETDELERILNSNPDDLNVDQSQFADSISIELYRRERQREGVRELPILIETYESLPEEKELLSIVDECVHLKAELYYQKTLKNPNLEKIKDLSENIELLNKKMDQIIYSQDLK
jgi:hypothetical protein